MISNIWLDKFINVIDAERLTWEIRDKLVDAVSSVVDNYPEKEIVFAAMDYVGLKMQQFAKEKGQIKE